MKIDKKIILLEHRPDYKAIYGLNLNVYIGVEVLVAATIREVVLHLEAQECSLIFVNADSYTVDVGQEVYNYLSKHKIEIPFYVLGKTSAPPDLTTVYDSSMQLKYILQNIAKTLGVTASEMAAKAVDDYFPLPVEFILPGWICPYDLFEETADGYEFLFKEKDVILCDEINKLEVDGIKQLYVKSLSRLKFTNAITSQLIAKLNDQNLTPEERMAVTAQGYQMVKEQARKIGVAESTMETAWQCIGSMKTIVEDSKQLSVLLNNLMSQDGSYLYRHSLLISFIGTHIIKKMAWGNVEQQNKFTFVAFFHDIVLSKDDMARLGTDSEVHQSNFLDKEKELILNHALRSAKLVSNVKTLPFGAETIIKQHHGSKNGKGLSKVSMDLSPLAVVFMVAEEWANLVLKYEEKMEKPDKKGIITKLHYKYRGQLFSKILQVVSKLEL